MENQHRKIKGYRELSQGEIDLMNEVKTKGADLGDMFRALESPHQAIEVDKRWLAIAKTQLQQGFMALTRAVAKPEFF